jgi:sialic acid synthase SpsE
LDRGLPGPDHWFAEDPRSLEEWVASIRSVSAMLGSPVVRSTKTEEGMKGFMRRSIMALRDIKPGEVLGARNVGLMRPGTGLPPRMIEHVLGRKATRKLAKGALLKFGDFA